MLIAIIGTAGRGEDGPKLKKGDFAKMVTTTRNIIAEKGWTNLHLISGGAAYADHVAVELFNQGIATELTLALPCPFFPQANRFLDTGVFDFRANPGGTAHHWHRQFAKKEGRNFLLDITAAIQRGAHIHVGKGFFDRNSTVATAEFCVAFTFGKGPVLKDGGTQDTMNKFLEFQMAKKATGTATHVDLHNWSVHTIN